MQRRYVLAVCGAMTLLATSVSAEEIKGTVATVDGKKLIVSSDSEYLPAVGDRMTISVEIPGVGPAEVGVAKVTGVDNQRIEAEIQQASGRVAVGHEVTITSNSPRKRNVGTSQGTPIIGVVLYDLLLDDASQVFVQAVLPGSPAESAGFQRGDRVVRFEGEVVTSEPDLMKSIAATTEKGQMTVTFDIERHGEQIQLAVTKTPVPLDHVFARLHELDEQGVAWAEVLLAFNPQYSNNPSNRQLSNWLREAAEHGSVLAARKLAMDYQFGANDWLQGATKAMPSGEDGDTRDGDNEASESEEAFLGVSVQDLNAELAKTFRYDGSDGVLVSGVIPQSPAVQAGLKAGDILVRWKGEPLRSTSQFAGMVATAAVGVDVDLVVFRSGESNVVTVRPTRKQSLGGSERSVAINYEEAEKWYKYLIDVRRPPDRQGDRLEELLWAAALTQRAILYERGQGVEQDLELAEKWYRQAVDRGLPYAARQLGRYYELAKRHEAIDAYYQAAEMGSVRAYADIGYLCLTGTLVEKDHELGLQWMQRAMDAGSGYAAYRLGVIYVEGLGGAVDRRKGEEYLRKAMQAKYPDSAAREYLRKAGIYE
ncbi:MAG: PDZ domain-containing protein [Planctomycetaceae bacterium]|nr:PDZ domain-containing protein [Planctomycetales bacterium]MCB9926375.1 PDZ domain-containing protein [Planctomycetaceae bacterium]